MSVAGVDLSLGFRRYVRGGVEVGFPEVQFDNRLTAPLGLRPMWSASLKAFSVPSCCKRSANTLHPSRVLRYRTSCEANGAAAEEVPHPAARRPPKITT